MNDPRYPIGKFHAPPDYGTVARGAFIRQIEETPARLRDAINGLSERQLDHPYREGGWMVRQVAHRLPDSHMNSYIRFKLGSTLQAESPYRARSTP